MGSYLYRRPENSAAKDAFEKIGCFLMCGLDCFTEELVTYHNQSIITHYKPTDPFLPEIITKIWNVAKLIFAPLSLLGFPFLAASTSYSQFVASIGENGKNILDSDKATEAIWKDVHGSVPYNEEIVGKQNIWDYTVNARKEFLSKLLETPTEEMTVNRETGEVKAKINKTDCKGKLEFTLNNIPVVTPETPIRPLELMETIQSRMFDLQLGPQTNLIRNETTIQECNTLKEELRENPHRILILRDDKAHVNKKVTLTYLDKANQYVEKEIVNPTPELIKTEMDAIRGLTKHSGDVEAARASLAAEIEQKQNAIARDSTTYAGITINPTTFQYEYSARHNDQELRFKFPLYLPLSQIRETIEAQVQYANAVPSTVPMTDEPGEIFMVNEAFLRAKLSSTKASSRCNVEELVSTLMELNQLIDAQHPGKNYYTVALENLQQMIAANPTENWGAFVDLLNRSEYSREGPFTADELMDFLNEIAGKNVDGVLYALHLKKQGSIQGNSLNYRLVRLRNDAIDRYIKEKAVECDCSEELIRRELVRAGLGIDYPTIKRSPDPVPPALADVNLLEDFQTWLTLPKLLNGDTGIEFNPNHLQDLGRLINHHLNETPYREAIAKAKANLIAKKEQGAAYSSEQWYPRIQAEREAIEAYKQPIPADLSPEVGTIIQVLTNKVAALKAKYPNYKTDPEQLGFYLEEKIKLVDLALEQHRRWRELEREQVQKGELSVQYFNRLKQRILKRKHYIDKDNYYTAKSYRLYLKDFALK